METVDEVYRVHIDAFEGPLDLLLHLIKKNEINIYDIPIALITQKYIETLDLMQTLNLSVAGDYLVMAATLVHIKSKMLLPPTEVEAAADEDDPRQELVVRLLEYQKFRDAARFLEERENHWRDVFSKEPSLPSTPSGEVFLSEVTLYDLIDALQGVLRHIPDPQFFHVTADELSVKDRMQFIIEQIEQQDSVLFGQLFDGIYSRYVVVVTFLALLEAIRLNMVSIVQLEACGPLRLLKAKPYNER